MKKSEQMEDIDIELAVIWLRVNECTSEKIGKPKGGEELRVIKKNKIQIYYLMGNKSAY